MAEPGRIRIVSLDGSPSTVIPVTGATPASLGWAAGDDKIAYRATDGPGDGLDLRVIDVRIQADKRLTPDLIAPRVTFDPGLGALVSITRYVEAAAVSPDGTRVALAYHDSRCASDGCSTDPEHLLAMDLSGGHVVEVPIPTDFGTTGLEWSPDGTRLLLGSIAGLVSVPVAPGSPAIVHSKGEVDLEWSGSEITWQPVFPGRAPDAGAPAYGRLAEQAARRASHASSAVGQASGRARGGTCGSRAQMRRGVAQRWRTCFGSRKAVCGVGSGVPSTRG